jgi:AcrR family transcriptional regulator
MTMGQLRRAVSPSDRAARRAAILAAASALLERHAFTEVSISAVARRAQIAKGTVFLYFPGKEALFLELADQETEAWLVALHADVARDPAALSPAALADAMTARLMEHPLLLRLLPLAGGVLLPGVSASRAAESRHRLLRRLFATGAMVEQRLGLARGGDGVRALAHAHALLVGLLSGGARTPDVAELRAALTIQLHGYHRRAGA